MSIPGSANPLLLKSAAAATYSISRSLRFNAPDSAFLSRTPASAGNRRTWTWAAWVKRSALGSTQALMSVEGNSDSTTAQFWFSSDDKFRFGIETADIFVSNAVFRDCSAWYHIVFAFDATNATSADKMILYVNGVRQTTSTYTAPSNTDYGFNRASAIHVIGRRQNNADWYLNGCLADVFMVDGLQLAASNFGESDVTTGVWNPKIPTGITSYGTNGFRLPFSNNASTTTISQDSSGNNNHWTANNISVTQGNGNYIANCSNTLATLYNGQGPVFAFSGNSSTATPWQWSGTNSTGTFAPTGGIPYTSQVRVKINPTGNISFTRWAVNGGADQTFASSGEQWITVLSGSGTFTSFTLKAGNQTNTVGIQAFEVDGVVLVDKASVSTTGNDSLVDSPTNGTASSGGDAGGVVVGNYAVLNPLSKQANCTLANGNLDWTATSTSSVIAQSTIAMSSGKWYCEFSPTGGSNMFGLQRAAGTVATSFVGGNSDSWGYYADNGNKYTNGSASAYGSSFTTGDVIGVAFDADSGTLTFYKNGVSQGQAFSGLTNGPYTFAVGNGGTVSAVFNAGARPFAFAAPAGFRSLNTANLPTPPILNGATVMNVLTWTGASTSSARTLTGLGFSPDFVWAKNRSGTGYSHNLYDTNRGTGKMLVSNATDSEYTNNQFGYISAFNSDGFTTTPGSTNNSFFNELNASYVAWCWDGGTSTVTNTAGTIAGGAQVRANASAGFSIVTWQAPASGSGWTVGHGLGAAPFLMIDKCRSNVGAWSVYHQSLGATKYLTLNLTDAAATSSAVWNDTTPTSQVFTCGTTGWYGPSYTHVTYCFAPVAGFSAFGSFTGNGNATDGPFVYTGHRSRWLLLKCSSVGDAFQHWHIFDTARSTYNQMSARLQANSSAAEDSFSVIDFTSNGFKIRYTDSYFNQNGSTWIWASFAESPFSIARAR